MLVHPPPRHRVQGWHNIPAPAIGACDCKAVPVTGPCGSCSIILVVVCSGCSVIPTVVCSGCSAILATVCSGCSAFPAAGGGYTALGGSCKWIRQKKYASEVLERFQMKDCNLVHNPIVLGLKLVKNSSENKKGKAGELIAFSDSDYAGDLDDRKSTTGYVFMLSSGVVSWSSKKQPVVTLSTTEAKFIVATTCACQGLCSAIKLSKNLVLHGRSKHIDVRFHFLHDLARDKVPELSYCQNQEQAANILTKPLKGDGFIKLRGLLGVCSDSVVN
ncbi:hypothetical protein L3X38_017640 [Prunus dulcis]|uniref:Uncharacterized protein n=1 Tax=Prunus dulcis TaxID=3755 RepID=A0AAD4W7P9_PRUDU|nr:hypothetical protein L3X38_017640 [Prunus dulcis]